MVGLKLGLLAWYRIVLREPENERVVSKTDL